MRVVVCDDDPVSRAATVDLVKSFPQLTVVEAADGEEAWALLQEAVSLLCCSTIRLPELSGIELLRRARATPSLARLPFVMICSAADRVSVAEAVALGAIDCMPRPVDSPQARKYLSRAMRRVWASVAEEPEVTLERLALTPEGLERDYHALEAQIDEVAAELATAGTGPGAAIIDKRLPELATSCVELGLWRGEEALVGLLSVPVARIQVFGVLAAVREMVRHQIDFAHSA